MLFFALKGSDALGRSIAEAGGFELAPHEEREFEGGEHKARPLISVRGQDVYVLHSLHGVPGASANDKLLRLLFFIAACRDNGAERITAIVPYLAYSRKDRQTKSRDPVTTRYVAALFEACGVDRVVTVDVHSVVAYQNAFRRETIHLDTRALFARAVLPEIADPGVVVSPDGGGMKRAQLFREVAEEIAKKPFGFAFMEKRRSGGVVTGSLFAGDVDGASAVIVDDMIVGGGTMLRTAQACRERGARAVFLVAAHALFAPEAVEALGGEAVDRIFVTDSVAPLPDFCEPLKGRLTVVSLGPLVAKALRRLQGGGSITDLLEA